MVWKRGKTAWRNMWMEVLPYRELWFGHVCECGLVFAGSVGSITCHERGKWYTWYTSDACELVVSPMPWRSTGWSCRIPSWISLWGEESRAKIMVVWGYCVVLSGQVWIRDVPDQMKHQEQARVATDVQEIQHNGDCCKVGVWASFDDRRASFMSSLKGDNTTCPFTYEGAFGQKLT